jgi:hypothetical protein
LTSPETLQRVVPKQATSLPSTQTAPHRTATPRCAENPALDQARLEAFQKDIFLMDVWLWYGLAKWRFWRDILIGPVCLLL